MKPNIPKGTRDFGPEELAKRNYLFQILSKEFLKFGFQPIETPSFENSSTLMGKYGEEGDRLIFKILNSGEYLSRVEDQLLLDKDYLKLSPKISEKALRYDLTVPFARYVVQHQNEITFPFKRYQMQPVWRADRPQKGRFREFFQCDADVVGSDSLWQEVEFIQLYDSVFSELKLPVVIKINNRKILAGIAELIGESDKLIDFTVALDKLDKIGVEKVTEEMRVKGISEAAIGKVTPLLTLQGNNFEKLEQIDALLKDSKIGKKGIEELKFVLRNIENLGLESSELLLDITLARGLNYYTGAIFEVQARDVEMGSVGGGGRYDDLTGIFGLKGISGVGISFGLDRIYLVLEELNLFKKVAMPKPKVMFVNFGKEEALYCLKAIKKLRSLGISSELFPDTDKLKKQLNYANKRDIDYVVMAGVEEIEKGTYTLKNMVSGDQSNCDLNDLVLMLGNK
jgi:histidyl-tRNA synthetase